MHRYFALVAMISTTALSAASVDEALTLWKQNKLAETRAAFQAIVAAEPANAPAHYYLGLILLQSGGPKAVDEALPLLEKATTLAPNNADYLAIYGEAALAYAQRHTSLSSAKRGRDALEAALNINPDHLSAREMLYRFYAQAPWPLGSKPKAETHLVELRKRSPNRAMAISFEPQIKTKHFDEIFQTCEDLLAKNPDDGVALFQYGRTAALSGKNADRGIECLQRYIALALKFPDAPSLANAWGRIGNIEQKRGRADEARVAYKKALELEPNNKMTAAALASVK